MVITFPWKNGFANAPQCYAVRVRTLSVSLWRGAVRNDTENRRGLCAQIVPNFSRPVNELMSILTKNLGYTVCLVGLLCS